MAQRTKVDAGADPLRGLYDDSETFSGPTYGKGSSKPAVAQTVDVDALFKEADSAASRNDAPSDLFGGATKKSGKAKSSGGLFGEDDGDVDAGVEAEIEKFEKQRDAAAEAKTKARETEFAAVRAASAVVAAAGQGKGPAHRHAMPVITAGPAAQQQQGPAATDTAASEAALAAVLAEVEKPDEAEADPEPLSAAPRAPAHAPPAVPKPAQAADDDDLFSFVQSKPVPTAASSASSSSSSAAAAASAPPSSALTAGTGKPAGTTLAAKFAARASLFSDDEPARAPAAGAQGLEGVFVPKAALLLRGEDERLASDAAATAALLSEASQAESLDRFGAGATAVSSSSSSTSGSKPAAAPLGALSAALTAPAKAAAPAAAPAALDDDLFAMAGGAGEAQAAGAEGGEFNFAAYIASETATVRGGLFEED